MGKFVNTIERAKLMGSNRETVAITSVTAIIVTYRPELEVLSLMVKALSDQCERIILIDNASNQSEQLLNLAKIHDFDIILNNENIGIAAAHNKCIRQAKSLGASHVLLMDQDSNPAPDMVYQLLKTEAEIKSLGYKVATIGPQHSDVRTNYSPPFISTNSLGVKKVFLSDSDVGWCRADFVISSGSLITIDALDSIGLMEEPLFIDCVDIEWGFRAASKGYSCFGAFNAKMQHSIGDKPLSLLGGRKKVTLHSPLRHYYFYRNLITLCKRPYPKIAWKVHVLFKSVLQFIIFSTLTDKRREHFLMMLKGVYHGLTNKLGKINE